MATCKCDINMILLGDTGVGKSTFINALANYLTYTNFENALTKEILVLVPFIFTEEFVDGHTERLSVGFDRKMEIFNIEDTKTRNIRKYVFPFQCNTRKFHIVDTPGFNGTTKDPVILENILNYISNLSTIDAICFFFDKSNIQHIGHFKYYMEHFFPQLNRCATENVVFIFTKINDIDFDVKVSVESLRTTLEQTNSDVKISLQKNVFYFENDNLQYLIAYKNGIQNMVINEEAARKSWKNSFLECWRLINYIRGSKGNKNVKPYSLKNSQQVCTVKRTVAHLIEPLIDVIQLISYNVNLLQNHEKKLIIGDSPIDESMKQLCIPVISYEMVKITHPITICTACAEVLKVSDINVWNYPEVCHKQCYLSELREDLVDDDKLKNCCAMDRSNKCIKCYCDYSKHRHLYYQTKLKQYRIQEQSTLDCGDSIEKTKEIAEKLRSDIRIRKNEFDNEHNTIVICSAIFTNFLERNTISVFKDPFEAYIQFLISRETSLEESLFDKETVQNLEKLLEQYKSSKSLLNTMSPNEELQGHINADITPENMLDIIEKLHKLKYMGKQFKELYRYRINNWMKEHSSTEYIITGLRGNKQAEQKSDNEPQQSNKTYDSSSNAEKQSNSQQSARGINKNHQQPSKRNERPQHNNSGPPNRRKASNSYNNANIKSKRPVSSRNAHNPSNGFGDQNYSQNRSNSGSDSKTFRHPNRSNEVSRRANVRGWRNRQTEQRMKRQNTKNKVDSESESESSSSESTSDVDTSEPSD